MAMGESNYIYLILTHMEDDGCTFWAQQHSKSIKLDLEQVTSRLEKPSASNALRANDPIKGRVYGCQYGGESWYRCRVLFSISKNKYLIQYIDYGNCEEKDKRFFIDVPSDLQESNIPALAHRFRLHDIYVEHDNVEKAQLYVRNMCSEMFVKAKLMSEISVSPTEVLLYDEDGSDVCENLLNSGVAITAAADAEIKRNVKVSPPIVSMAQKYRNPLISSSDESSDDCNNNKFQKLFTIKKLASSQSSGLDSMHETDVIGPNGDHIARRKLSWKAHCDSCQVNKDEMQKLRLSMMKMRHDLADSDSKIVELVKKEEYWKKKFMEFRDEQMRQETFKKEKQVVKNGNDQESSQKKDIVKSESKAAGEEVKTDVMASPKIQQIDDDGVTKANSLMKKVVLPAFEFAKKLTVSCKTISDCQKFEQKLREIVEKIKLLTDKDLNRTSDVYLSLLTERNAILQDLQQAIGSTLPLLTVVEEKVLKPKVENFLTPLKKLAHEYKILGIDSMADASDIAEKIRAWKMDKENSADISEIVKTLLACLTQISNKLFAFNEFFSRFKIIQDEISTFQSQKKIIKDTVDEMKSIRKCKQKIRLLVAGLKNLEEEKDADLSEKESIRMEIKKIEEELSTYRNALQESFETKWMLLESLADMTEKFSPELQIEHPELTIKEYIKGKGIVMNDMEIDHFDIDRTEWSNALKMECFYTSYRRQPIVLHKYTLHSVSDATWDAALQEIAMYTNVECPNVIAPMGIFYEKDATFIMVTVPQVPTVPLAKVKPLNSEIAKNVMKKVAIALSSLHENGICHGQLSHSFVFVSEDDKHHTFLSMPNMETRCAQIDKKDVSTFSLATDVHQFGLLTKTLSEKTGENEALENIANFCIKDSASITMKEVLEQF